MNYRTLFRCAPDRIVRVALVGAGEFGASFLFQAGRTPNLDVSAVCTRTVARALDGYAEAGIASHEVAHCRTQEEAAAAFQSGKRIVTADINVLMGLPLDVLVESSGNPEAGAIAAELALQHGMHVVMVSKEVDSVVGPVLCHKARQAGLVYTTGEGDQPSLLIGLISWAQALGLDIVAAGKSSEYDFVYDADTQSVHCHGQDIATPGLGDLWNLGNKPARTVVASRTALLSPLPHRSIPDLCEMCVVANATGLLPDVPSLHAPAARIVELPDMMALAEQGGVLQRAGRLDIFNCLRRPDEASMAGGVFVVVACEDAKSWAVLEAKGHPVSRDKKRALIYHPSHLLGVESPISVLAAALLGQATGGETLYPHCDLTGRATHDLKAGTVLSMGGHHHVIEGVAGELILAVSAQPSAPVPFYLLTNATLVRDVAAGAPLTYADVQIEQGSLWRLRQEQERIFKDVQP